MLYELRHYYISPGKMNEWVDLMDNKIIPFQLSKGMMVMGSFIATDKKDVYIWIRRYENEENRQHVYDEVYGSDYWKNEIKPRVNELLQREHTQSFMMQPTAKSFLQ